MSLAAAACEAAEPIRIGSRLEPMVDDYLIDTIKDAKLALHQPAFREVVMRHDVPWEGNISISHIIFQDGPLYRMYYRGGRYLPGKFDASKLDKKYFEAQLCYAESDDGIHWRRPELGLVEFNGSKKNNILWSAKDTTRLWNLPESVAKTTWTNGMSINCSIFKDANPDCPADARYKMLGGYGACAFKSPDGIHFTAMSQEVVIPVTLENHFDSQTTAYWDSVGKRYVSFHRATRNKLRDIVTNTSTDFLHWSKPVYLEYTGAPVEELYTNQIAPYFRAPHILMGFPKRYAERRKAVDGGKVEWEAVSDGVFMTSRDGLRFHRWGEALIRPGLQAERWVNRNNYIGDGIVVTRSADPGMPDELSIYSVEGYWSPDNTCRLRRHTIRIDGFVSVQAPRSGGELLTKPIIFEGKNLVMNYSTSAAGSVSVELQTIEGKPVDGFALADCGEIYGDQLERVVAWKGNSDLGKLAGTSVRLHFVMKDADLYSIQFRP
jgi:hypothetical protein